MEWYELNEQERIKNVYSKYTIQDFWEWWCNDNSLFMEIRIKDFKLIKQVAQKYSLPYSLSGVYVNNPIQLKNVIWSVREIATIWFGINPRKVGLKTKSGRKGFAGDDYHIYSINHIFIDIDRLVKEKSATTDELKNANILANLILERFGKNKWNERYIKICSGNGIQLLIALDVPMVMPLLDFNVKYKSYIETPEYEKTKMLIKETIGKQIKRFAEAYKNELKVDVDMAGFKIGQVGALPVTKNYKYDSYTWRGILEMKSGLNDGLSDYIYSKEINTRIYHSNNVFSVRIPQSKEWLIKKGELEKNLLVRLMLDNQLPYGMINNKLWFSLKLLLRDSKFDLRSEEFKKVHRELEQKYKGKFTLNIPNRRFKFDVGTVNNYCVELLLPLIYPFKPTWIAIRDVSYRHDYEFLTKSTIKDTYDLPKDTTIFEDMDMFKRLLVNNDAEKKRDVNVPGNSDNMGAFINSCVKKYGEKATRYYFNNLFNRFFISNKV